VFSWIPNLIHPALCRTSYDVVERDAMTAALDRLAPRVRMVVELRLVGRRPWAHVARLLRLSDATVRRLFRGGLATLRRYLERQSA
jgi:DNA-directed RNA polymerase specialized sigma24 family protein